MTFSSARRRLDFAEPLVLTVATSRTPADVTPLPEPPPPRPGTCPHVSVLLADGSVATGCVETEARCLYMAEQGRRNGALLGVKYVGECRRVP